jgi:hypothetical protein
MKKHLTTTLLSIAIVIGLIWLNSCKKENLKQTSETSVVDEENEVILEHILDFKSRMEYHKANPGLKSGTLYTPPDAVEEVEALINFNFCYTDISCNKKTFEKTEVTMPLDELGKIGESRLAQLYYEEIIDSIQARMLDVNYPNMKLLLVDLEQTGTDSNGDAIISIGSLLGVERNISSYETEQGWWYGNLEGTCAYDFFGEIDAAKVMQWDLMAIHTPLPPAGWILKKKTIQTLDPIDPSDNFLVPVNERNNYLDAKLFYANRIYGTITEEVRCLSGDPEMDFYLSHSNDFIQQAEDSTGLTFTDCTVQDYSIYDNDVYSEIWHELQIHVGNVWFVQPGIEWEVEDILAY